MPEEDLGFEVAVAAAVHDAALELAADDSREIGRASCRERV